jgi:hypothetical protein
LKKEPSRFGGQAQTHLVDFLLRIKKSVSEKYLPKAWFSGGTADAGEHVCRRNGF